MLAEPFPSHQPHSRKLNTECSPEPFPSLQAQSRKQHGMLPRAIPAPSSPITQATHGTLAQPCLTLQADMHPKKVTVKKVTGVKLVTLFILILAVTQHIH